VEAFPAAIVECDADACAVAGCLAVAWVAVLWVPVAWVPDLWVAAVLVDDAFGFEVAVVEELELDWVSEAFWAVTGSKTSNRAKSGAKAREAETNDPAPLLFGEVSPDIIPLYSRSAEHAHRV
jgi:hypothetical protein